MTPRNSDYLFPPNSSCSEDRTTAMSSPGSSIFDLPQSSYEPPPKTNREKVVGNAVISDINSSQPIHSSLLVISGGTGANSLCAAFGNDACYALPVSDDGGSSSEIIRVIGKFLKICIVSFLANGISFSRWSLSGYGRNNQLRIHV